MKYCKKCVQPDTRPGIKFNDEGICPACYFYNEAIDWKDRRLQLEKLADFGRKHNVSGYDCIIGVSGGKDSTRQAMYIKDEVGMKPLLVCCSYPPEQLTKRGAHNLGNLISLGFDCISISPDPQVWKAMMRQGFLKYGNWCKSTEAAIYASSPKIAIAYHIPLVFLGENPAIALGDLDCSPPTGNANAIKYCHTLKGGPEAVAEKGMTEKNFYWYRYPTDDEMRWADLRVSYLGYYIKDFSRFKNAEFSIKHGLMIRDDPPEDIGDAYGFEALDDDFVVVNQMFKYLKYGFGKVTDQAAEAIRLGIMNRKEAIKLVKKYDGGCAQRYIDKICQYLEITKEQFWEVVNKFRNKDIWEETISGKWKIKADF